MHVFKFAYTHTQYLSGQLTTISALNWRMYNTFTVDSQKHSHRVISAVIYTV